MKKVLLALLIGAAPAAAQPAIGVDVNVNVGDNYDTAPPGEPVESVDVFYDQLEPYGVWVDEPDAGRVFIPEQANFVPYQTGHWQYTSVGFVWVSNEPFAWATTHYGRWAYSNAYARWYWAPDTEWGPAWVQWRETGGDFGWAPLPPSGISWEPPVESWHYCPSDRVLDVNVTRYYEPRDRVVVIHREARPIRNEVTMGRTRVVVGPGAAQLRERHIAARPVKVEARVVGRWSAGEAHAQVVRAQERRVEVEKRNQVRIESSPHFKAAQVKVIETHPEIRTKIDARVQGRIEAGGRVEERGHGPVVHQPEPERGHGPVEHGPVQPAHPERAPEPTRVQPAPTPTPQPTHGVPGHEHGGPTTQPRPPEPQPERGNPERGHGPVIHQPEPVKPAEPPATHRPPESGHGPVIHQPEPARPAPPAQRAPEPVHAQPAPPHPAPTPAPQPRPAQPAPPPKAAEPHPTAPPAHSGEHEHGEHEKK